MTLPLQFPTISPPAAQPQESGMPEQFALLLQAISEKKQRELQQQQLAQQLGQLTLQQEKFKAEEEQRKEQKKGLEEMSQGLIQSLLASGQEVGPAEGLFTGAAQTGQPEALEAASKLFAMQQGLAGQKQAQAFVEQTDFNIPEERGKLVARVATRAPEAATPISEVFKTMGGTSVRIDYVDLRSPDGTIHKLKVVSDRNTGEELTRQDLGEARPSYVDRLLQWGDVNQRDAAYNGTIYHNAYVNIRQLSANKNTLKSMTDAVTVIEGLGTLPMGLGDVSQYTSRAIAQGRLSPDAQVMLNNVYDLLAAEGFGRGGKQLTAKEWAAAIRSLVPVSGESPKSIQDKISRMDRRWRSFRALAGPAWGLTQGELLPDEGETIQTAGGGDSDIEIQLVKALEKLGIKP